MFKTNALSDKDIIHILKSQGIKFNGIFMKDELPSKLKQDFYIIHLQSSNIGDGTHWTCPISFTTNRNININGTVFSCYDIDLTKYVRYITLDGYNIRKFRLRSWLADADFQGNNSHQLRYDIFMSNRGGLSIYAMAVPFDNEY